MFWKKQEENDYDNFITYSILCKDTEYCGRTLDTIKKLFRGDIYVHKPIDPEDDSVKKVDFIVDVANNERIIGEVEKLLRPTTKSMEII